MSANRRILIFDTTLRDGEQSPGCSMNLAEKLEMAHALVELGVDIIEAGFPIASNGDFEAVRQISEIVTESGFVARKAALLAALDDAMHIGEGARPPAGRAPSHPLD